MRPNLLMLDEKSFEELCQALLHEEFPRFQAFSAPDLGMDGYDPDSGTLFQCYFPEREPRKDKVAADLEKAKRQPCTCKRWVLLLPKNPTALFDRWLRTDQQACCSFPLEVWGKTEILRVLRKHPKVKAEYFPSDMEKLVKEIARGKVPRAGDAASGQEISAAFLLSESAAQRCRDFRLDRLRKIQAGETPLPMAEGPKAVLHICPIGLASQRVGLGSDTVNRLLRGGSLSPVYESGYNSRYNFDGFLTYTPSESAGLASAYLQVFRSGCIETVDHRILKWNKAIPSIDFEEGIIKSLPRYFEALKVLNIETPVFVMISLVGVLGFRMGVSHSIGHQLKEIDRQTLICPEVLVEDFNSNVEAQMKPAFDAVWNAAGSPGSVNYQGNKWVPAS